MFSIMVVEDDINTRRLTADVLEENGYTVITAKDGAEALDLLEQKHVDLLIADIMMPRMDGYELTRQLRLAGNSIPIIMVTAKEAIADKKKGFIEGTDDYMVKPVDEEELLLRIAALLRRSQIANDHRIQVGSTLFDYDTLSVTEPSGRTELPLKEFMLVYKLLSYPDKIFTRRQLIDEIWDMTSESDERTVDVHINRLRERFRDNTDFEIVTIRGLGYKGVKKR
ncbi:MAG: response regulator transcription factor [Ruminococcus sp.]|nr:response regulator transcription factor [Ruminococcus sp.]